MRTCPCGSGASFSQCCQSFIDGRQQPLTAEALMRSRYSAYTNQAVEYLVRTTHPSSRNPLLAANIKDTICRYTWLSLQVISRSGGGKDDTTGVVEFMARYRTVDGQFGVHRECSRFERYRHEWYYLDGGEGGV